MAEPSPGAGPGGRDKHPEHTAFHVTALLMAPRLTMCDINLKINCGAFYGFLNCLRNETWLITVILRLLFLGDPV